MAVSLSAARDPWNATTFEEAMTVGARQPVLSWLLEAGCPVDWQDALKLAASKDSLEMRARLLRQQQRLRQQ